VAYLQFGVIAPNPVFRGWMDQNVLSSPNVLAYLVGFGLLVPLALTAAIQAIPGQKRPDPFPLFWIAVGSLLLYAPIAIQRRLAEGLQIPLGVLAALGWQRFRASLPTHPLLRALLTAILVSGLVMSTLLSWTTSIAQVLDHDQTVFLPPYQVEAMTWMREHSNWTDTVLSSYWSGSYIPAWAGNRVVMGHWAETIDLGEKMRDAERFFDGSTSSLVRGGIVRRYKVHYLYYGPYERHLGDYDPGSDPDWRPVFANEEITIYRHILAP
jgi:hypothetical protein